MKQERGVSLLELLTVVVIIGILAALTLPLFEKTRERALDNEAKANLKLIQAAEKIYCMELGFFMNASACTQPMACINEFLRLNLPVLITPRHAWNYNVFVLSDSSFTIVADRNTPNPYWRRRWFMDHDDEDATCSGAGCPR